MQNDKLVLEQPLRGSVPKQAPRRSRRVIPVLLAAAALVSSAALAGCSNSTTSARCVDQNGNVLPDSACPGAASGGYAGGSGGGYAGSGGARPQARWVYGGAGGTEPGSKATGFSDSAPSEGDISSPSGTVIRGGFGGEGEAHGGGEGGHGGGGE